MRFMDVYSDVKIGEFLLFQERSEYNHLINNYLYTSKPILGLVVGIDLWDMACVIYYVKVDTFDRYNKNQPEISHFNDWDTGWFLLGRWDKRPTITELKSALRSKRHILEKDT